MKQITVIAKVTGYHPASGLYLVEGNEFTIDEEIFAADIFDLEIQNPKLEIAVQEGGND